MLPFLLYSPAIFSAHVQCLPLDFVQAANRSQRLRTGRMTTLRSRRIHISVLVHVLGILFLAKAMVLLSW